MQGGVSTPSQNFSRTILPNGARIVTEEIPGSRSIALGVWIATGSRSEEPAEGGSAHFIEHLLFKGTPSRSASALAREIDSVGGHLDAFTGREYTCFYLNVLAEQVERGMEILADIFLHSSFPPHEVERERNVILEEIRMSEDSPEDKVYELLVQNIWPRSSLGRPILGTASTIASLSRSKLLAFRRRYYRSSNLVFAAAGGMDHDSLGTLWRRHFPMARGALKPPLRRPPRFLPGFYGKAKDLEQTHLCFGTRGLGQASRDRYALYVLNNILGGTMSSRLFQEIREKRGLAYSVFSTHSSYREAGLFMVSVGTSPVLAPRVVRLVEGQLKKLCARPPSRAEVKRARDQIKGSLILSLESSGSRMMSLAKQEIYFGRHFGIDDTIARVERVEAADVHRVAQKIFQTESSAWAAVGPEESLDKVSRVTGKGSWRSS
ncbi:M16 family metallopeptidase [Candidatus Moduliflexota bacterium]